MEEEIKSPFDYLLVAMNYAKAAVENGGIVDMFDVHPLIEFGYGEGEMFFRDFLSQFGEVDDGASMTKSTILRSGNRSISKSTNAAKPWGYSLLKQSGSSRINSSPNLKCSSSLMTIQMPPALVTN